MNCYMAEASLDPITLNNTQATSTRLWNKPITGEIKGINNFQVQGLITLDHLKL